MYPLHRQGDNTMNSNRQDSVYKITFQGGETQILPIEMIQSPTILRAINYIDLELGCVGVMLTCGIQIEKVGD